MAIDIGSLAKRFLLKPLATAAGSANRWADNYAFGGPNWREKGQLLMAEKRARLRYLESQIEENQSQAAHNRASAGREQEAFDLNKELTLAQVRAKTRDEAALHKRAMDHGMSDSDFIAFEGEQEDSRKKAESDSRVANIQTDNERADRALKQQNALALESATTRNMMAQVAQMTAQDKIDARKDKASGIADQAAAAVEKARTGELTQEGYRALPAEVRGAFDILKNKEGVKLLSKAERDDMEQLNTLESDLGALRDLTKSGDSTGWQGAVDKLPIVGALTRTPHQQKVDALTMRILSTNLKARSGAAITGTAHQAYSELQRGLEEFPTTTNTDTNYQAKIDTLLDAIKRSRGVQQAPIAASGGAGAGGGSLAPAPAAAPGQSQIGRFLVEPE